LNNILTMIGISI